MEELMVEAFEQQLQRALERVRVVLDAEKTPCLPSALHHQYEDKYLLSEFLTNTAAASQLNCLAFLGLGAERVAQLRDWAQGSAVQLRLRSEERCTFLREETRDVEDPTKQVNELSVGGVVRAAVTSKVVTKVTEYFWKLEVSYELLAVRGVGEQPDDRIQLLARTGRDELKTTAKNAPRPEARVPAVNLEVDVSWLFRQLPAGSASPAFQVDRSHAKCRTPRRNPDVEAAGQHFTRLQHWAEGAVRYLEELLRVQPDSSRKLDLNATRRECLVLSVTPLLLPEGGGRGGGEAAAGSAAAAARTLACLSTSGGMLLAPEDANSLLAAESRALEEKRSTVSEAYPAGDGVATSAEGMMVVVLRHCAAICSQWTDALEYLEALLRKQLINAIGEEVTPAAFAEYMRFHNRKLFADEYVPAPFCFPVRRSETHAPEGTVSIEQVSFKGGDPISVPVVTMAARAAQAHPMSFPLSASTSVNFGGERYLHAWLAHRFSGVSGADIKLVSRARQFSSMLVLVGRIASATVFEPTYAAIVQNKDELTIPLELSTIPTPKEFKDAIQSLSPEQQAFAKAFRAMQLESTLFGVLVIQIKPQLEKVLNLAGDSLTKEIKLTQDLMQLFIKYQIPSDLLSFDASASGAELVQATPAERLEAVKAHVKGMQEMLEKAKQEEVAERRLEASYAEPQLFLRREASEEFEEGCSRAASMEMKCMEEVDYCSAPMVQAMMAPPPMAACMAAAPEMMMVRSRCAVPAPTAAPAQVAREQQPPQQQQQQEEAAAGGAAGGAAGPAFDYTQVPKEMDKRFEKLDSDSALRPTIIKPGEYWEKRAQKALLASPVTSTLDSDEQKQEKDAAFDLLDALTKSGALTVDHAALHIVIAATHCFDKSVTDTVVEDNVNPIDKVERSTLIMASTVHRKPVAAMIREAQYQRRPFQPEELRRVAAQQGELVHRPGWSSEPADRGPQEHPEQGEDCEAKQGILPTEPPGPDEGREPRPPSGEAEGEGLPSEGSAGHALGKCKPCLLVLLPIGCGGGAGCSFCHFSHDRRAMPRPSKGKRDRFRRLLSNMAAERDGKDVGADAEHAERDLVSVLP